MSDTPFLKNEQDELPLDRNTVPILSCSSVWLRCGLLHAAETGRNADRRIRDKPGEDSGDFLARNMFDLGVAVGSEYMEKQPALGDLALFLDIYPLHRFYMGWLQTAGQG